MPSGRTEETEGLMGSQVEGLHVPLHSSSHISSGLPFTLPLSSPELSYSRHSQHVHSERHQKDGGLEAMGTMVGPRSWRWDPSSLCQPDSSKELGKGNPVTHSASIY